MRVTFELQDIKRVYGVQGTISKSKEDYLVGKLEHLNNSYKAFYGELDKNNQNNLCDLIGVPTSKEAKVILNRYLKKPGIIDGTSISYDNKGGFWLLHIHYNTNQTLECWYIQGNIIANQL